MTKGRSICLLCALLVMLLAGCTVSSRAPYGHIDVVAPPVVAKPGPPPHAPAYGHRARHHYHYYPDARVYFDTGRGLYFYLDNGSWSVSASLPAAIRLSLGSRVSIKMDADRPYVRHKEHRRKYPGKKHRHKQKRKGKYKKRWKYDDDRYEYEHEYEYDDDRWDD